jgi:ABC-type uncharacterized transport system ATPase subunit
MTTGRPLLEVDCVTKAFPGVLANDAITFDLRAGEIHALLGENGAGKTTLMGILFGLHRPDRGRVFVDGTELAPGDPQAAIVHGIGFVQQHYSLIPTLTVIQNLVLSSHYGAGRSLGRAEVESQVRETMSRHGFSIDLSARVEALSVGEQQHVELVKALVGRPRILILDEPAALLSGDEIARLWDILRDLARSGVGIILIGHKLGDVLAISNRITVLRRGRVVATVDRDTVDAAQLGAMMVGDLAPADVRRPSGSVQPGLPVLEVEGLRVSGDRAAEVVRGVSFTVRAGEVLGIAGVAGSGQVEMLEAVAGIRPARAGAIRLNGADIGGLSIRERQARGVAFVPSDRHRDGLVGQMSCAENLALAASGDPPVSRGGVLRLAAIEQRGAASIARFDIRVAGPHVPAKTLSGGNQQKLILARELSRDPVLILCCYPTRGLDFAATAAVHGELRSAATRGAAVVVVSMDLDELLVLADRLIVTQSGKITGALDTANASAAEVGLMLGGEAV